jgi:hypothetical protein
MSRPGHSGRSGKPELEGVQGERITRFTPPDWIESGGERPFDTLASEHCLEGFFATMRTETSLGNLKARRAAGSGEKISFTAS